MIDCEHRIQRDEIWYGRERHDEYCDKFEVWSPCCAGCPYSEQENKKEEDYDDE